MQPIPSAPARKTSEQPFFFCNSEQDALFSVRAGTPTIDALEQASCFLGVALEISRSAAEQAKTEASWGSPYLIEASKAIVDSVLMSLHAEAHAAMARDQIGRQAGG